MTVSMPSISMRPLVGLVEARQQVDERGLADAAWADDGDHLAWLRDQVDAVQHGRPSLWDQIAVSGQRVQAARRSQIAGRYDRPDESDIFKPHVVKADQSTSRVGKSGSPSCCSSPGVSRISKTRSEAPNASRSCE